MTAPTIVVAYDSSPAARAALSLAVDRVHGGKLFIVHAYGAPKDFWGAQHYQEVLDRALQRGEDLLDAVATIEPRLAEVDFDTELIPGNPARLVGIVKRSFRYIASGSWVLAPSAKATLGLVGPTNA